jgi:hypothetical protein
MALVASEMKAKFQTRIQAGLSRVFSAEVAAAKGYPPVAAADWMKLADAISDIAMDIVMEIQTNAEVIPGQSVVTVGTPVTQTGATITPGKIE